MLLLLTGAFAAGLVSFFSPCIIPILPGFLAGIVGKPTAGTAPRPGLNWHALFKTLHFTAGFSLIFILMGLSASSVGRFFHDYQVQIHVVGGALVVILGLIKLELIDLPFFQGGLAAPRSGSSFLLGMAFSVAWSPCVGPVLASVLIVAGAQGAAAQGVLLLALYSLGLTLPFLVAALFWDKIISRKPQILQWSRPLNRGAGVILVVLGLLMMTGQLTRLAILLA